jgi:dipeptidyl aminopeptidase/acylaminoacyl peptidase
MRAAVLALAAAALWAPPPLQGQSAGATGLPAPPRVIETTLELRDGSALRYAIAQPNGYDDASGDPRPLVLALHPGGRSEYYGSSFLQSIVEPALRSWGAVMIAPDVPDRSWATPRSEQALLALVEEVIARHVIDRERVLVTGFSMGGRGAWHMVARHSDVFTGAVVMAGSPGEVEVETLTTTPLYLVHSPDDEVVPFEPVEQSYLSLSRRGHPVELRVLPGAGHYAMGAYVPALRAAGAWMLARWARVDTRVRDMSPPAAHGTDTLSRKP